MLMQEYYQRVIKNGEILSMEEVVVLYSLREGRLPSAYRELEPKFKKVLKYGIVAVLGLSAIVFPLPLFFLWMYRRVTDPCQNQCRGKVNQKACISKCYMNACEFVIKKIKRDIADLSKLKDKDKRDKMKKKLMKEMDKWVKKRNEYKTKLTKL